MNIELYLNIGKDLLSEFESKYSIGFWMKSISGVCFFLGTSLQLYFLLPIKAIKFFSFSQVLVDGTLIFFILIFTLFLSTIAFFVIGLIEKITVHFQWMQFFYIFLLFLISGTCFIKSILYFGVDSLVASSILIFVVLSIYRWYRKKDTDTQFLLIIASFFSIIGNVFTYYNSVNINGIDYHVKYMNDSYIFTKEGYIFDRDGNKFYNIKQ